MILNCISSMATKSILTELINIYNKEYSINNQNKIKVNIEFKGGIEVKSIILNNSHNYDLVFLSSEAINDLEQNNLIDNKFDLVSSNVGMAINQDFSNPNIETKEDLFKYLLEIIKIGNIGYSTGPSGIKLISLLKENSIYEKLKDNLIQSQAGIPVAQLIADKKVILGFQQLSELINYKNIEKIRIIGKLPDSIAIKTIFSVGVLKKTNNKNETKKLIKFLNSDANKEIKLKSGFIES